MGLRLFGHIARVVDQKINVRVLFGGWANVIAERVLIGLPAEWQSFVNADVLDPQFTGLFNERLTRSSIKENP